MYAYADEHTPEREMIPSPYFQMLQAVVIEDAVIYPLTGSTFLVDILILLGIPWYTGLETQVCIILYVDSAPIAARGAGPFMGTFLNAAAFEGAAVFTGIFDRIIAPGAHFMPGSAEGMPQFIKSDVIRGILGRFSPAVDVDEGIHVPAFQQSVSGDVVMCGVKADIFRGKAKAIAAEIIYCIEEI